MLRLQCSTVQTNKFLRGRCPGWQIHIVDRIPILQGPEADVVDIDEEIWQEIELWYEFFEVLHVGEHPIPAPPDPIKHPVRHIELPIIEDLMKLSVRF